MKFTELGKNLQEAFSNLKSFHELYFDVHGDGKEKQQIKEILE